MKVMMLIAMTLLPASTDATKLNPIEAFIVWSRGELEKMGLTRKTTDAGAVYWSGGATKGKTLVLLHGANDQAGTWALVAPALQRDYRLIIPDLAGHGESEPKSGAITFAAMLEQLHAVVEAETKEKVTVVGNSMGAWIAILYAIDHPERVERIILEDGGGMYWAAGTPPLQPKNREEAAVAMRAAWGPEFKASDELLDALIHRKNAPLSRFSPLDIGAHIIDPKLKDLKVPASLIWGRHDGILPLDYAKALQEKIPGSTLTIIDGAAHIPHRQTPETFVACLKATF